MTKATKDRSKYYLQPTSGIIIHKKSKLDKVMVELLKGGPGSGNHGHVGCIGEQGGSCDTAGLKGSDLERIGNKAGTVPGGIFKDKDGKQYLVKAYPKPMQAAAEVATNNLYRAAGIPVPESKIVEDIEVNGKTQLGVANTMIDNLAMKDKTGVQAAGKELAKGYGVDALTANWDVVGLDHDNIGFANGEAIRLDNGGSLIFRAQGGTKDFPGHEVKELDTLLDPSKNPNTAAIFNKAFHKDPALKLESLQKAGNLTDAQIEKSVREAGFDKAGAPKELVHSIEQGLKDRRDIIAKEATKLKEKLDAKAIADADPNKPVKAPPVPKGTKHTPDFTDSQKARIMGIHNTKDEAKILATLEKLDKPDSCAIYKFTHGQTSDEMKEQIYKSPDNFKMRDHTVAMLLKKGIIKDVNEKIPLKRGFAPPREFVDKIKVGSKIDFGDVTCWSDSENVSKGFAQTNRNYTKFETGGPKEQIPVLASGMVHPKRVLNTYKTGAKAYHSYLAEKEWTLTQARRARVKTKEIRKEAGSNTPYWFIEVEFEG